LTGLTTERCVIAAELYRRNGGWKVRAISQGFDDLARLIAVFGVQTDDAETSPSPASSHPSRSWRVNDAQWCAPADPRTPGPGTGRRSRPPSRGVTSCPAPDLAGQPQRPANPTAVTAAQRLPRATTCRGRPSRHRHRDSDPARGTAPAAAALLPT
jgi:hypothetical protein